MTVATSSARQLTIALSACLALGAASSPLREADAGARRRTSPFSASPPRRTEVTVDGAEREPPYYDDDRINTPEVLDRVRDAILRPQREARLRRGLTPDETPDERKARASGVVRERRRQRKMRERREDLRLGRRRRLQVEPESGAYADGFILSSQSPGIVSEDPDDDAKFYVVGVDGLFNGEPEPKSPLILRDLFTVVGDGTLPEAVEIFWRIDIICDDTDDCFQQTARLPGLNNLNYDWFMDTKKYKSEKKARINKHDPTDPLQVFDFRPGPEEGDRLTENRDATWRANFQLGYGNRGRCMEPSSFVNGTLQEDSTIELAKCTKNNFFRGDQRRLGKNDLEQRRRQTWIYCFQAVDCTDEEISPPDFTITVDCDETPTEEDPDKFSCENKLLGEELDDGEAVEEDLWDDLDPCDEDTNVGDVDLDKKFGKSLVYQLNSDEIDTDDGVKVTLNYFKDENRNDVCDGDTANAILRVYRQEGEDDNDDWICVGIAQTDCDGNADNAEIDVQGSPDPIDDDVNFLFIVSSDGTDNDEDDKDLGYFDLALECDQEFTNDGSVDEGDSNDDLYCYNTLDDETLNVEDDETLPSDFDENSRSVCPDEEEDIDPDQTGSGNAWSYVDTRSIESSVTVETLCNNDGEDNNLETLIRIYKIDEDDDADVKYDCVNSKILDCDEDEDDAEREITERLEPGFRYLIVGTGALRDENCDVEDFRCL